MRHCIIIGSGISGLSAATELFRQGKDIRVLESEARPGGTIDTLSENGFLADFGPNSILNTTGHLNDLIRFAGLEGEACPANPAGRNRFIVKGGKLLSLPLSPLSFLTTPLFSLRAKLRLLGEPFVSKGGAEENIGQFAGRRLGREMADYAVGPFVSGVYAGNPQKLSVRWAVPKVFALEEKYGSLLWGAVRGARERKHREKSGEVGKQKAGMINFKRGMASLPLALMEKLGEKVKLHCPVTALKRIDGGWQVDFNDHGNAKSEIAEAVILSVPAFAASPLITSLDPALGTLLSKVEYAPVAQVFLGFQKNQIDHPLDGFGALAPQKENRHILGVLFNSSLFPGRAPEGHVALTCFLGGALHPDLVQKSESELLDMALKDLSALLGIRGFPAYHQVRRWNRAIPQYNVGYGQVLDAIVRFELAHPGIRLCANFRGGISVGDCVRQGVESAQEISKSLSLSAR